VDDPRILIATPVQGSPHSASVAAGYHQAVLALVRDSHFNVLPAVYGKDVVRARSRVVRQFLETTATHLLWWDADVVVPGARAGRLIARLVALGEDFVGCTYPKKRIVRWGAEATAYDYPISLAADGEVDARGCCEVEGLPLGFTLCSRATLERMVERYADLAITDVVDGVRYRTVPLFQLVREPDEPGGLLLGEDYSFAHRWRAMGGRCLLYVGADCELGHVGGHLYQGTAAGFCR
jgi:hypothetical protein